MNSNRISALLLMLHNIDQLTNSCWVWMLNF